MNKFTSNLFRILCGVICFLSVSCQNFLSGGSFMEQLTKDIDYANADEYTLVVDSDKTRGGYFFLPAKKNARSDTK